MNTVKRDLRQVSIRACVSLGRNRPTICRPPPPAPFERPSGRPCLPGESLRLVLSLPLCLSLSLSPVGLLSLSSLSLSLLCREFSISTLLLHCYRSNCYCDLVIYPASQPVSQPTNFPCTIRVKSQPLTLTLPGTT